MCVCVCRERKKRDKEKGKDLKEQVLERERGGRRAKEKDEKRHK